MPGKANAASRPAAHAGLSNSAFARREIFRTVGQVLWRFRKRSAAALGLLLLAKLFAILVPVALKGIVDSLEPTSVALTLPVFLLLGYALLRFLAGLFTELRDLVFVRVTQTAVADFTVRMFDHLHSLGVRFHGSQQTGVFSRDVQRGTAGVGFLLGTALFTILPTLVEIVTVLGILLAAYRPGFAGIVALTFAAYAVYTVIFTERRTIFQRQVNELDSAAGGHLVDSLLNYETVKFYTSQRFESQRLQSIMNRWIDVGLANQRALSVLNVGQSGIIGVGVAAVMLLAGQEVVSGRMAVGDLILVNAYVIQICLPLSALGMIFRQSREALINAERMSELLRYEPEVAGQPAAELVLQGGAVEFRGVDFSYEPGRQILHDIDFAIPPGGTVAVVGGSGSGKSTLARLLLRFYDADSGSIVVDGQDVRSVSQASLRAAIGVVPQDALLFNNTIGFNIAYGKHGATAAEVSEAAKAARIHELIESLPAKYETMVGERGVKLSGGERQRIAIARAVLKNPPLLIFDEATSALDTRTEKAIQAELDQLAQGRSTLIIAHRLSTVVDADLILVMDHGRIVERGTHAQLLKSQGLYAQMWDLQRQQTELDASGTKLSAQPVNLVVLIAGVLDALRPAIDDKGIAFYTLIGQETTRVTGDPSALQQLIFDVCESAIAFTPVSGRIELRLERDGGDATVSITDSRLMVPEQHDEDDMTVIVPEQRLLDPVSMDAIMQQMGGRFEARPSSDETGMTFTLRMPLRAVASLAAPSAQDETKADKLLEGLRAAVADDQAEARELLAAVLDDRGARTATYESGDSLLLALRTAPASEWPDVLICDISLGEPDGYEVIAAIRQMEAERSSSLAQRLPAIALSGYSGSEDRLRALLAGFQVHVGKPVDPRELVATVLAVAGPRLNRDKAKP